MPILKTIFYNDILYFILVYANIGVFLKMRVKRRIPYIIVIVLLIAYLLFLALSSSSFGSDVVDDVLSLASFGKIRFENGRFPADSTSISVVLESGETSLLSKFTDLRSADFSGSECYDEIIAWADANPGVNVSYTVTFPNGKVVSSTSSTADLSGLSHENISQAISLFKYLPSLNTIDLGTSSSSASPITADDINSIRAAYPDVAVSYSVSFLGRDIPIDSETADLSGLSSSQLSEAVSVLSMLQNLKTIDFGQSENSSVSIDEVISLASNFPNAAVNYTTSVAGKTISLSDEMIELPELSRDDVDAVAAILPYMSNLTYADIGGEAVNNLEWDDVTKLCDAAPNCVFDYDMTFWTKQISLADETLDLNHIEMLDEGASVKALLPYMHNCKTLDMDSCLVSNEAMASIRDEYPDIEVIWRVNFGENYSVRTNVVKILASKPSKGGALYNDAGEQLKYCTNVHYLDLGHNEDLSDFSFVAYMPELEVAVISMSSITDLTPFASCTHLKYLEAGNTDITDLTPLASCTELKHLNIGTCAGISDISCLNDLDLKRFWIGSYTLKNIPQSQISEYEALHPDCEVNTTCPSGLEVDADGNGNEGYVLEGWKYWQQYLTEDWNYYGKYGTFPAQRPLGYWKAVYKAFEYNLQEAAYAFSWNDPMYSAHDDDVEPVNMTLVNLSILSEDWEADEDNVIPDVLEDPPGEPIN